MCIFLSFIIQLLPCVSKFKWLPSHTRPRFQSNWSDMQHLRYVLLCYILDQEGESKLSNVVEEYKVSFQSDFRLCALAGKLDCHLCQHPIFTRWYTIFTRWYTTVTRMFFTGVVQNSHWIIHNFHWMVHNSHQVVYKLVLSKKAIITQLLPRFIILTRCKIISDNVLLSRPFFTFFFLAALAVFIIIMGELTENSYFQDETHKVAGLVSRVLDFRLKSREASYFSILYSCRVFSLHILSLRLDVSITTLHSLKN